MKKNKDSFYDNRVVFKPWGYEYTIYRNKRVAVTFVNIKYKHKTSLHSHPNKLTGFIVLNGNAMIQHGIYKENSWIYPPVARLVLRPGLFHSIEATSKKGVQVLEIETPVNKNDLVRFQDKYGRQHKPYEGKIFTKTIDKKNMNKNYFTFNKRSKKIQKFYVKNTIVSLERLKNFKSFKKNDQSSAAILEGDLADKKGRSVIKVGEVVRTSTLRILSDAFKLKKKFTIIRVSKSK